MKDEIFSLGKLFEDVQMQNVFTDSKSFVDCTPNSKSEFIQQLYEEQKNEPEFNISTFVSEHFTLPKTFSTGYKSDSERPIKDHLELLWNELTRHPEDSNNSLIPLPHSYIVPGGRFREIYYWDSYFTMLGLQVSGRDDMIKY